MDWKAMWDSVNLGLDRITEQLLMRAGGSTGEMRSRFSFGEKLLEGAVAHLAFLVLNRLLDRDFSLNDMDHDLYQDLRILVLELDLSEELAMLARMERVITLLLHLARIKVPSCDILSILNQEVAQGNTAMHFFPDANTLSVYSSVANMDVIQLFVVSLYVSIVQALSRGPTFVLASKAMGQCAGAVAGQAKRGILPISHNWQEKENSELVSVQKLNGYNVAAAQAEGNRSRAEFLKEAQLTPPPVMRVIDCQATCNNKRVVLRDMKDCAQEVVYSAISHTYGQEVYNVFNCKCATICTAEKPRCSLEPCPHDIAALDAGTTRQIQVMNDILNMCATLREAGVDYAWHDGVCIAQHDDSEVKETIEHIGWIYANASETIIFLSYVGKPIAPIGEEDCRWHTRVWTLQEAALSKCRRYCIRVGTTPLGNCDSLQEFERVVALWNGDECSKVEVVEEERFFEILKSIKVGLVQSLEMELLSAGNPLPKVLLKLHGWCLTINSLLRTLQSVCFSFPTIDEAIEECTRRNSKHRGDRINSILALAKVKGFVAAKDDNVEASTIEFFARQGQIGLAKAVFSGQTVYSNAFVDKDHGKDFADTEMRRHTWLPSLSTFMHCGYEKGVEDVLRFKVLQDGKMELRGPLVCIEARFVVRAKARASVGQNVEAGVDIIAGEEPKVCAAASHDIITYVPLDVVHYEGDLLGSYRVTLSRAPDYSVGNIVLPVLPVRQLPRAGPMTDGLMLQEEESFDAHLVLPGAFHTRFYHAFVVQGDLYHQVSKIGLFIVNASFHDDIRALRSIRCPLRATALGKLVII